MKINCQHPLRERINGFLYSPAYLVYMGALAVLANVFCLERFVYPILILTGVYICLFARDFLPIFPIFACGYISPSVGNNPGANEQSIFSVSGGFLYLAALLFLLVGSLIYRLVTDPNFGGKQFLQKKRVLLPGMLVLGICYAISGLTSGQWEKHGWQNLLFAFVQMVAIAGLYCLLSGAVDWEKAPVGYLFWTGICVGYVLVIELANIYLTGDVIEDGVVLRHFIVTGWGHYNSMGVLFAMVMPLPFYLAKEKRTAPFAYITAFVLLIALVFTHSRASIVVGLLLYIFCYVHSLVRYPHTRSLVVLHLATVLLPVATVALFWEELLQLSQLLLKYGVESPDRNVFYTEGIKQFLRFPIFGGSFFPVDFAPYAWATSESFLTLFPPRWHNTLVQLLATGGVTCLAGYVLHRVQTVKLFVKDRTPEKLLAGLSVLALLITSLLDCHFFNVGPVLIYSGILAFAEYQLGKPQ